MTRCVLFSYDIKRLLFNTLFGFFLMMAMLGNGYAAPTTLSTVAELERYGLVVKGNSGLRLTREGTNVVQIHLYERYLTNPTDSPYQVTTNNGVVSIEIELDSEAHETLRSMEDQLHSQFVTTYNDIAYRLTHPHNLEQTYNMLGLLLNRYTEIVVPRFATPNTLDAPIETVAAETQTDPQQTDTPQTVAAETQTDPQQTDTPQTVAAEIQADPPQTDPPQIVAAEIQADTPQTGTPQTVEAEILIGTSQAVEAETQADTPQTDTPQTDPPQTVAAEIQADTPQTVAAETPIDSTPTFEEGIQNAPPQTVEAETLIGTSQTVEVETPIDSTPTAEEGIQTGTPQTAEAETLIGTSQAVEAETPIDSTPTAEEGIQTGTPQTVEAETLIVTSQTVEAETPIDSTPTAEEGIQTGTPQIVEAETLIGTSQTVEAETPIDSTPTAEEGIQTGTPQTVEAETLIGTSQAVEAETPIDSTPAAEEGIQTGTPQTAGEETQNDELAIQADAEPPASVQTAMAETQTVTEKETTEDEIVNTVNPIVTPLLAVAAQCGGEDNENGGGNNENNVPGIFTQSWQQIVLASRTIANGVINIPKRLANGAINTTRSLGNGVVGVTKYLGREATKAVSYLYNLASGIVKPVLSAHNKSKKQTSRHSGRARRAKAAPLLTTVHYVVFSAIAGLASVAGYYYRDSVNNRQKTNQRSTMTSLYLLEKAKYFEKALKELSAKKQKEIAQLIERFSQSHWEKHHFPITAVYEINSHTSYIDDYHHHGWQNCQSLRFGMVGYNPAPAPEAAIEPLDHSGPNFPVSHKQFSRWVTKTITHLFDKIPDLLNSENPAAIDTIAQTLMLCGIPIGKPGQALHKECVTTVAGIIGRNGLDWHQKGMHIHSMHNTQRHELTGHQASLTFVPDFSLNQHCTHLDKLSYAPRIRQSADAPFPSLNKPFFADSGQTFQWSPEHLPEQFSLLYYPREGGWTLAQAYNETPSTIELNMASIYGIQGAGEDTPSRILAFTNRQMIESHPAGTKTNTQDGSVIHSASSTPGSDRYWLYQQNDMGNIRSQRVRQNTMSYLNSVRQTISGSGVKRPSILAHIFLFEIAVRWNGILHRDSKLSYLLDALICFSVVAYHELLAVSLSSLMHSPPYANPKQEAAERYRRLKQLRSYYLNDRHNYPHHNLLTSLLSDTEAPLGVIHYNTENLNESNERLIANYYEPLSYISFKEQKKFFDQAVERCARYFGRNSCDPQSRDHLDFIQFYLTICSTTKIESCEAIWKQSQSRKIWKIIVSQYDWTEIRYPFGILNYQFDTHSVIPVIRVNKKRPELDLKFSKPWPGYIRNILGRYQAKPLAPVLSVTGEKHAAFPEPGSISAFDNETQSLWVLPWKETALIAMTNVDDTYLIHPVILNKNRLLPQTSNRMIKWYEDNNVRVKECHEVDYPNLFHLCKKVSDNNQKKFLIFLLNSRIKKSPWIAVYRPELEHGSNPEKDLYFRFSDRIHFKDLSIDRLERHIDAIDSFYGKNRSGMVKLIDSAILTESLAEVGLLSLSGVNEAVQNRFYEENYQLVFDKKEKPDNLFSDCIMDKLQKDQLCAESTTCVLMMQGWKLESSTNSYSHHPLPVWIQNGKVYNSMPVDNSDSMVVASGNTPDDQTMNTYVYDDGWQEITKISLTPSSDSLTHYNQGSLYISSPEPIEQVFHRFDLTIYRNEQKYMDSCPGTGKP